MRLTFLITCIAIMAGCGNQVLNSAAAKHTGEKQGQADSPDVWYKLMCRWDTVQVLDADLTGGVKNGSKVQLWTYTGTPNQHWKFVDLGNGYFRIINRANVNLSLDADVMPGPVDNGAKVQVWEYVGSDNQKWQVVENPDYILTIHAKQKTDLVIDADNTFAKASGPNSMPNGTKVQLWTAHGGLNQVWYAMPVQ